MSKKTVAIMPSTQKVLENMGEQIKLARLRRNLSTELLSERAGISRATLWAVEKGSPTVAMGIYAAVLHALGGLDKDLELIAKDDEFGRRLQDMNLMMPKRAKRSK
ncbi:MAG: transcriptional regulator [Lachnospiraceae bacterium]|nr:transcriptional regulator [Lachnospiraceae bacterium]